MKHASRELFGPNRHVLPVCGQFSGNIKNKGKISQHTIYVINGLEAPLLGRPFIRPGASKMRLIRPLAKGKARTGRKILDHTHLRCVYYAHFRHIGSISQISHYYSLTQLIM